MKEIDGWIKIKKYTDDEGKPVCGGCIMLQDSGERYECDFEGDDIYPGPLCPVWHGESKSVSNITKCGHGTRSYMACKACQDEISAIEIAVLYFE